MANTAKKLAGDSFSTLATVYTVGGGVTAIVETFDVCNTTAQQIRFRIFFVDSGDTADTTNAIYYDIPVPANGALVWRGHQVLSAGDTIQVYGAASGLCIRVSGVEIS